MSQQQESGTALARSDRQEALEKLRGEGRLRAERVAEMRETAKLVQGMQFGDIKGSALSEATRWQIAKMCFVTGADPSRHVDILGSRPYLNAEFWAEKINTHQAFVDYNQREISESTEKALREAADSKEALAEQVRKKADETGSDDLLERAARIEVEALELREEAEDLPVARAKWGVPDWATDVVETTIRRYQNGAPMDAIRADEMDPEPWIKEVRECNWAGGKGEAKKTDHQGDKAFSWDPIGDASPAKTARSRSLRRCAIRAFPAWQERFQELLSKAEKAITADIDLNEAVESSDDFTDDGEAPTALTGAGEPEIGSPHGARELPEEGASVAEPSGAETSPSSGPDDEDPGDDPEEIDRQRKAYFANLRDGPGITTDDDRHQWQTKHDLPPSTTDWTIDDWQTANRLLVADARREFIQACDALQVDAEEFAEDALGFQPMTIGQYRDLTDRLETVVVGSDEADAEEGEDQAGLPLDQ